MPFLPKPKKAPRFPTRRKSSNRREDKRFYDSIPWKLTRINQLSKQPYCEVCNVSVTFGGHIDHIVRRKDGGAELDERNLQTLCRTCHDAKSRLERHHGSLIAYQGENGQRYPAKGEKERLITKLRG